MQRVELIVVLVLAGLGTWLALRDDGGGEPPIENLEGAQAEDEPAGTLLIAPKDTPTTGVRIDGVVTKDGTPVQADVLITRLREPSRVPLAWWIADHNTMTSLRGATTNKPLARVRSNKDGTFSVPLPGTGLFDVRASVDGIRFGVAPAHLASGQSVVPVSIAIPGSGSVLTGRAQFHDGRPFAGHIRAYILAQGPLHRWGLFPGTSTVATAADGTFSLPGLARGRYTVEAAAVGERVFSKPNVNVPHLQPLVLIVDVGPNRIRGQVVDDETSEPIANAAVSLMNTTVVTDTDGRFETGRSMDYVFGVVRASGYPKHFFSQSTGNDIVIRLPKAVVIRGTVRTAAGTPVPGVPVVGHKMPYDLGFHFVYARGVSDPNGRYELNGLPPGDLRVVALGNGWSTPSLGGFDAKAVAKASPWIRPDGFSAEGGETVERDIEVERAARLEVKVLDVHGDPVAGAEVAPGAPGARMATHSSHRYLLPATTDADGLVVFDAAPWGTGFQMRATHPEHGDTLTDPFTIEQGKHRVIEITFSEPKFWQLTVTDADTSAPIEHALAHIGGAPRASDASGQVRVGPVGKDYTTVSVSALGYLARVVSGGDQVDVALDRAARLTGTAYWTGGTAAHVRLHAYTRRADGNGYAWAQHAQADHEGVFHIEIPATTPATLDASWQHEGHAYRGQMSVNGQDVAMPIRLDLRLHGPPTRVAVPTSIPAEVAPSQVALRVLGPDGQLVRSATAQVIHSRRQGATIPMGTGTAKLPLQGDDPYWISIYAARDAAGARCAARFSGPHDPSDDKVEVGLKPPQSISGLVVDHQDRPVQGVSVMAGVVPPAAFGTNRSWAGNHGSTHTDKHGAFELKGLGEGDYEISLQPPPGLQVPRETTFAGGTHDVRLVLSALKDATVRVLDPDGKPIPGAVVRASPLDRKKTRYAAGQKLRAATDAEGKAHLLRLDPSGLYRLEVGVRGRMDVERTQRIAKWRVADTTIRLARRVFLRGVVQDADGNAVPDALVWAQHEDGSWHSSRSGQDGAFTFFQLAEGTLTLYASMKNVAAENRTALVGVSASADATGVILRADPGTTLVVTVRNWREGDQTTMYFQQGDAVPHGFRGPDMGSSGTKRYAGLDPNKPCAVFVGPTKDGRCAYYYGPLPANGQLALTLEAGGEIRGAIHLPPGAAPQDTKIQVLGAGLKIEGVIDGKGYRVRGVPPGEWTLAVRVPRANPSNKRILAEPGQTHDFDFRK